MSSGRRSAGFTLVEVMIALAILSFSLVSLLVFTANNVFQTGRVAAEGIAVDLARGKLYDLEEDLLRDGFQPTDQAKEGDFDEEGWAAYHWSAVIEKIELPELGALQKLGAAEGQAGAGKPGTPPVPGVPPGGPGTQSGQSPLGGLLGGGAGAASGNDSLLAQFFPVIKTILEEGIRKITLKLTWPESGENRELVVSYFVTDPNAVGRTVPGSHAVPDAPENDKGDKSDKSDKSGQPPIRRPR